MNKICSLFLAVGLLPSFSLSVSANSLVEFPSGDAAWTVNFSPSAANAESGAASTKQQKQPSKIEVTQINKVRRIQITWNDGTTTEQWALPPLPVNFEEDPRNGSIDPNLVDSPSEGYIKFVLPCDASAFHWVTPSARQEKDPIGYQGIQCFHYLGHDSPAPGAKPQSRETWIDSNTLRPVALDTGTSLAVFTFAPKAPIGPLVIPAKFKKAIDYYKLVTGYR